MKLSRTVVFFVLAAVFVAAVAARFSTLNPFDSPYFKGPSAMHYRHAEEVANRVSLRAHDPKANHPDGYTPARPWATGAERVVGWSCRAARFFGEDDARAVTRRTLVLMASLCVFTAYALARRVWNSQAAGLLAAGLVALLPPLVNGTNGRTFSHEIAGALALSLYALAVFRVLDARGLRAMITAGLATALAGLLAMAVWESAWVFVAAGALLALFGAQAPRRTRYALVASHALAMLTALVAFGYLTSGESFPTVSYAATRIRHLFGRPESASLLSERMRHVWALQHGPPDPRDLVALFLPVGLVTMALALNREIRDRVRTLRVASLVAAAGIVMAALDRSALPVVSLLVVVPACGGARGVARGRVRMALVALAACVAFTGVVFRGGRADLAYQAARLIGVAGGDPAGFEWVSLENTDRELVRFVSTRTSVRESILAPDDVSALLLAFTGRTAVTLPGGFSREVAAKRVRLTRALYGDEATLYSSCRELKVDYVLYSIDVMLDPGRYSPRYLAAETAVGDSCIAYRMHFDPASIRHFTLLYENDHYRLFKVTDTPEPVFLTDHPPFYDRSLFAAANGDVDAFSRSVVQLMLTYADGVVRRSSGDLEGARARLLWVLERAPRFTRVRLALADVLMDMELYQEARAEIMTIIAYAPDNSQALYYAAFVNAQLGQFDAARSFLELLSASERDPDLLEKARVLGAYIDQGLPLTPGSPRG